MFAIHTTTYTKGIPGPAPVKGSLTQPQVNQFVTALSMLLNDSPAGWADRIVITVKED